MIAQIVQIFKLRIGVFMALTALAGYAVTPGLSLTPLQLGLLALLVFAASGAAGAFNEYMERDLDAVVCGVGTCGTLTGMGRFFKRVAPQVEMVLADPEGSVLTGFINTGEFEQIDSPANLYSNPRTPFVAQFVGDNNAWSGSVRKAGPDALEVRTEEGNIFHLQGENGPREGTRIVLFLRPEAVLIEPDPDLKELNRFDVVVKAILFDGANSRLLAHPLNSDMELLVALPQTRQYDYIQEDDKIEIGWHKQSGICFPKL